MYNSILAISVFHDFSFLHLNSFIFTIQFITVTAQDERSTGKFLFTGAINPSVPVIFIIFSYSVIMVHLQLNRMKK